VNHRRKRSRKQLKLRKTHQPCAAQPEALKKFRPSERRRLQAE
jgi:hypothetical protein